MEDCSHCLFAWAPGVTVTRLVYFCLSLCTGCPLGGRLLMLSQCLSNRFPLHRRLGGPSELMCLISLAQSMNVLSLNWVIMNKRTTDNRLMFNFQGCMAVMECFLQEYSWIAKLRPWVGGYTRSLHCCGWPHTLVLTRSTWWMCWHCWASFLPSQGKSTCTSTLLW